MRFMPKNPNPRHDAMHQLIVGCTGSGKSQLLKSGLVVPHGKDVRCIMYDDVGSLPGLYFHSRLTFLKALKRAEERGGGYRIGYAGQQSNEDHEWWCEVVWSVLDGNKVTYAVTEELAAVCETAGRASRNAGIFMNQGRKYGLRHVGTTQRPEEISKTYYSASPIKWIGQQDTEAMIKKMSAQAAVSPEKIVSLQSLQFFKSERRAGGAELVTIKGSDAKGVFWHP